VTRRGTISRKMITGMGAIDSSEPEENMHFYIGCYISMDIDDEGMESFRTIVGVVTVVQESLTNIPHTWDTQ
ncbi:hypothetical protein L195_g064194, partial [Trifolium pratense]